MGALGKITIRLPLKVCNGACVATTGVSAIISDTTDATCGSSNGTATVTASGGSTPYTYLWNDPASQTVSTATGLSGGIFLVTVTDASGCKDIDTAYVSNNVPTVAVDSIINSSCSGDSSGAIYITATGNAPFTYLWTGGASAEDLTAVTAGTYTVTVTDNSICTVFITDTIKKSGELTLSITSTNITCTGENTGTATATPTGGALPYTYIWSDPATQTTTTATGLTDGTYTVTVTDANSCAAIKSVTMTDPQQLFLDTLAVNILCKDDSSGTATVAVTGGTSPYSYSWSDASTQTTNTATGLTAGTYTVTVNDANSCTVTTSQSLTQPATVLSDTVTASNILCGGANTGTATAAPSGGTSPYSFLWNDAASQTAITATGLTAGTYTVTVTDANSCAATTSQTLTQPAVALSVTTSTQVVLCKGASTGTATAEPAGGTLPYSYSWSDASSQTTIAATGLAAGTYNVTVTDANGCKVIKTTTISEPATGVTANAGKDTTILYESSVQLIGSGGTFYSWSPPTGLSNASVANPIANPSVTTTYFLTVTDAQGCKGSDTVTVIVFVQETNKVVFVANVFSPNRDNNNDYIFVQGARIKEVKFAIYDRWGERVFETSCCCTLNCGWDGTYRGNPMNPATFVYILDH